MKIFKFYPREFQRQYFVARDIEHARSLLEDVWDVYKKKIIDEYIIAPESDEGLEELSGYKLSFVVRFADLEEETLTFIDTHY